MKAVIYHNSRCSKSRDTLALLEAAGAEITIVDYLKHPPGAAELRRLYAKARMRPRDGLRKSEGGAKTLAFASDDEILAAMARDPILMERPLVETEKGVRLGRPPERVREIL